MGKYICNNCAKKIDEENVLIVCGDNEFNYTDIFDEQLYFCSDSCFAAYAGLVKMEK